MEQEGQVLSVKNNTIKIVLPSLGYLMFAEVYTNNVEVILPTIPSQTEAPYPLYAAK